MEGDEHLCKVCKRRWVPGRGYWRPACPDCGSTDLVNLSDLRRKEEWKAREKDNADRRAEMERRMKSLKSEASRLRQRKRRYSRAMFR